MRLRSFAAAATCALALGATAAPTSAATTAAEPTEPTWAPAATAPIRPGVQVTTQTGGCTTNFIFYERRVSATGAVDFDVYIGLAAHCFSLGGSTGTNACTTPTRPLGSAATVRGAAHPASLAYSSWVTVKDVKETDGNVCAVNDFALVKLDPRDHGRVNPSLQYFGGPTGTRTTDTALGDAVYSYGNSSLRQGIATLSPKRGASTGTTNAGWSHRVYTLSPGVPGDSGSGAVDAQGRALGVVVTLAAAPFPGSNGVTDLGRALAYANEKSGRAYRLAQGTEVFRDPVLP